MVIVKNGCACQEKGATQKRIVHGPPDIEVPDISLSQHLLDQLRNNNNCTVQIDAETGEFITAKDILEKSATLAQIFTARGIKVGDRISIMSENSLRWMIPACATIFAGAVVAPLNPTYTERELDHMLGISKPRIIFVSRLVEKLVVKLAPKLSWSMEIMELDDVALTENIPTLKQLLQDGAHIDPYLYTPADIGNSRKHPAAIMGSSGTTGLPKGVTLSHRNLLIFLIHSVSPDLIDIRRNDKVVLFLPFFHAYGFFMTLAIFAVGAAAVTMRSFDRELFLRSIEKYRITHMPLVPPVLVFLAKDPAVLKCDFSSVREIICGAAALPKELANEVRKRLKCGPIRNAYGMTEMSVMTHMRMRSGDNVETVGPPVPGLLSKVVDPSTNEMLGPGQVGEICFKGGRVMIGYYGNARATAETIDKEGWLHSGDLGYFDEKDRFFVVGRLKELIKYKAYQVSPVEVETLLLSHPGVKDAAVVGKPDEVSGELPTAFVVRQPDSELTAVEIMKFVNGQLSPQKWLRGGVHFVKEIPKNPTGKILRKQLVQMLSKL